MIQRFSFLFLVFLLASSLNGAAETKTTKVTKVTLALNWKAEPEFGGFYAALINGEFKKRNLEVEILEGGSGSPTVQMLAHGKVDFAIVSADEIIISQDRNSKNPVRGLFAVYQTAPYIVMTHSQRGFKDLREVFMTPGLLSLQSGLPYYQFLIKKFGKPKAQIVPYTGGVSSFLNNPKLSQQGFITSEPLAVERAGKQTKNFLIADEGFNPYLVVMSASDELLQKNPDLSVKMTEAVRAGWQAYLTDPTPANKLMSGLNKAMDFDTFQRGAVVQKSFIETAETKEKGLGFMTEERWTTLVNQLHELKLIKQKVKISNLYQNVRTDPKP